MYEDSNHAANNPRLNDAKHNSNHELDSKYDDMQVITTDGTITSARVGGAHKETIPRHIETSIVPPQSQSLTQEEEFACFSQGGVNKTYCEKSICKMPSSPVDNPQFEDLYTLCKNQGLRLFWKECEKTDCECINNSHNKYTNGTFMCSPNPDQPSLILADNDISDISETSDISDSETSDISSSSLVHYDPVWHEETDDDETPVAWYNRMPLVMPVIVALYLLSYIYGLIYFISYYGNLHQQQRNILFGLGFIFPPLMFAIPGYR